jgi:hypothetical protein
MLRRLGFDRLKSPDPPAPVGRSKRQGPGELVHIDAEKRDRIPSIEHRSSGCRSGIVNCHHGVRCGYVHVAVDRASRPACTAHRSGPSTKVDPARLRAATGAWSAAPR